LPEELKRLQHVQLHLDCQTKGTGWRVNERKHHIYVVLDQLLIGHIQSIVCAQLMDVLSGNQAELQVLLSVLGKLDHN